MCGKREGRLETSILVQLVTGTAVSVRLGKSFSICIADADIPGARCIDRHSSIFLGNVDIGYRTIFSAGFHLPFAKIKNRSRFVPLGVCNFLLRVRSLQPEQNHSSNRCRGSVGRRCERKMQTVLTEFLCQEIITTETSIVSFSGVSGRSTFLRKRIIETYIQS